MGIFNLLHQIVFHFSLLRQALLTRCCCLSSLSLLDAPHLSDVALKAVAETNNLRAFSIEGETILHPAASTFLNVRKMNSVPVDLRVHVCFR